MRRPPLQEAIRRLLDIYPAVSDHLDRTVLEALSRRAAFLDVEGDGMTSLADLDEPPDQFEGGGLRARRSRQSLANELAEAVVGFIADRSQRA